MKKIPFLSILLCLSHLSFAQDTTGLIAHWNMNGTANDVTGHGHHGTQSNLTPAVGRDGVMGHAYSFNGTNSMITVPYSPAFNLSNYTICATVKVEGFYTGTCQSNIILQRGKTGPGVGTYALYFFDKPGDNLDCYSIDSTVEVFTTGAGGLPVGTITDFNYTPHIVKDTWYSVVATFDDTSYRMYVNGTLKNSAVITTPGVAIGASTDSISIGYDVIEAGFGYPYPFNGVMDDVLLYNRLLTTAEIDSYTTSTLAVNTIIKPENEILVYPNPAQSQLNIRTSQAINGPMDVKISDLTGRELVHTSIANTSDHIDIEQLTTGMYFISIYYDGQSVTRKFIKQ